MNRFLYFAGFAWIALCGAVVTRAVRDRAVISRPAPYTAPAVAPAPPTVAPAGSGREWFATMKPYCNPVEVDVRERYTPAPDTPDGAGYAAACFALAGKIDRARSIIENMPSRARGAAANILFEVAHPVADAGDDRASGRMMELVLDYWPDNYMALYHAGMSEYALGQPALARSHLEAFLRMYNAADGFTGAARAALSKIREGGSGKDVERETPARP
jgi:hypothetical protein